MRRIKKNDNSQQAGWLATYADMVTLLLCFFVLLFSFSTIDAQKFQEIMNSFQGNLGVLEGGKTLDQNEYVEPEVSKESIDSEDMKDFAKIEKYLEDYSKENNLQNKIEIQYNERGLVIRTKDNIFFDSGKAKIKDDALQLLLYIGQILNSEELLEKQIKVEGHTDNVIMNSDEFPSNWELSVIRATNVLRLLIEDTKISPNRISASGYGEFRPIAPNDTEANKAKNRRVDIVILKSGVID
ncbi:OmpA family protein [Clostridium sp. D2Q-11]|uniref:OmpA family protein n=1 Tax=Anaeromonas frigoriresistens TaxID=2683708 RepID=A0A942UVJ6_9FIRM|nr:flagellar motor protein MotB [Anaeromonas frigoriresistens]MBS4539853.1 OmpA family protein [Anaeromonas frigoriresistens]